MNLLKIEEICSNESTRRAISNYMATSSGAMLNLPRPLPDPDPHPHSYAFEKAYIRKGGRTANGLSASALQEVAQAFPIDFGLVYFAAMLLDLQIRNQAWLNAIDISADKGQGRQLCLSELFYDYYMYYRRVLP